jgi:hypothetical protein
MLCVSQFTRRLKPSASGIAPNLEFADFSKKPDVQGFSHFNGSALHMIVIQITANPRSWPSLTDLYNLLLT